MLIVSTFIRYGHVPCSITLQLDTLKVWALSLHSCSHDYMVNNDDGTNDAVSTKKKERPEFKAMSWTEKSFKTN